MGKREFSGKYFRITYTLEEDGPHPTISHDYYDDTYAVTIILQGEGVCFVEGNGYPLEPGTVVIMSPEEIRSFRLKQTGCHERISLYFTGEILLPLWEYAPPLLQVFRADPPGQKNLYTPKQYDFRVLSPITETLRRIMCAGTAQAEEARINLLILQLLFALYDAGEVTDSTQTSGQNARTAQICGYIKDHLTEDLSYEALQQRFLVSRYQLTEVFCRETGMTLTRYIIHKRLMYAMGLIRNGMGIESAAYEAGFHTYSHFYKEFKKRYHISPKEYDWTKLL